MRLTQMVLLIPAEKIHETDGKIGATAQECNLRVTISLGVENVD
jgi:hypothetical protein